MRTATDTAHCDDLMKALETFRDRGALIERWGTVLARRLGSGARLLVAGNGGSAAQAQHLTAELVGRYRDDRAPFSALALHADTSATTAIANDYGVQEVFARQTAAHGDRATCSYCCPPAAPAPTCWPRPTARTASA